MDSTAQELRLAKEAGLLKENHQEVQKRPLGITFWLLVTAFLVGFVTALIQLYDNRHLFAPATNRSNRNSVSYSDSAVWDLPDDQVMRKRMNRSVSEAHLLALNIFLIWTTARNSFHERHRKVMESYFYHHPTARISVYATDLEDADFQSLTRVGYRVEVVRLDDSFLKNLGTICPESEAWLENLDTWKQGPYYYSHITDLVRFCILSHKGGVYSDFDAVLLNRIDQVSDFIGKDSSGAGGQCRWCLPDGDTYLAPGLIGTSPNSNITRDAIRIGFNVKTYDPNVFNQVGPKAITQAYHKRKSEITTFDKHVFYPFNYVKAPKLFKNKTGSEGLLERFSYQSLSLHLFGHATKNLSIEENSIVHAAFKQFSVIETVNKITRAFALKSPLYLNLSFHATSVNDIRLIPNIITAKDRRFIRYDGFVRAVNGSLRIAEQDANFNVSVSFKTTSLSLFNDYLTRIIYRKSKQGYPRDILSIETYATDQFGMTEYMTKKIYVADPSTLVTIMVKTFGRMEKVFELVRSVRKYYPHISILVSDDGDESNTIFHRPTEFRGFSFIRLPFDIGLSAGRNAMIQHIQTKYFVTLDDDFIFDETSRLEPLLHSLEQDELDVAAFKNPVDEEKYGFDFAGFINVVHNDSLILQKGYYNKTPSGCFRVDIVPNLFMARTETFQNDIHWDDELKLGEHEDFFLRAKEEGLRIGTCPQSAVIHQQVESTHGSSNRYMTFRNRVYEYWKLMLKKHGLKKLISFNGVTMMDLTLPSPIKCAYSSEILAYSAVIDWNGCSLAQSFKVVVHQPNGVSKIANHGKGVDVRLKRFVLGDLEPSHKYVVTVYAGNGFDYEHVGKQITIKTKAISELKNLLKNSGFEYAHRNWKEGLSSIFHVVSTDAHSGSFSGRLTTGIRGAFHSFPRHVWVAQIIDVSRSGLNGIQIAGWSKVDSFYGGWSEWGLRVVIEFGNNETFSYRETFSTDDSEWQVVSYQICVSPRAVVKQVRFIPELKAFRGSVFFDDLHVSLF